MASITKTKYGYRAQIRVNGDRRSASFRTAREANIWGEATEAKIRRDQSGRADFISKFGVAAMDKNIDAHSVLASKIAVYRGPGVYVLFDGDVAVYVGKSKNIMARVSEHASKGRAFTHYSAIGCLLTEMDGLEQRLIAALLPHGNIAGV